MQAYLSPEYREKLDPTYRRKLENLEKEISATLDFIEKQRILDEFSREYLMPRQYWDQMICLYFFNNRYGYDEASKDELEKLRERALYQFYYDNDGLLRDQIHIKLWFQAEQRKLLKMDASHHNYRSVTFAFDRAFIKFKERQLTYPHQALDDCYQFYERYSTSAPSTKLIKKYREMKKLYGKIVAVKNDHEKWLEKLKEVDDEQFVLHNIEYRLGGNLTDKKLWNLYIEYLRKKDTKEMLHAYSKYCRFFIDDEKMLEKYKNESSIFGPINVPWKNRFDFELPESKSNKLITFDLFDEGHEPTERIIFEKEQSCQIFFNKNNLIRQDFFLPNTVLYYIQQTANHAVLQKLYKCCKYFFAKKQMPIVYKFDYICQPRMQRITFREQSIDIQMDQNGRLELENLFIANSLSFYYLPQIKYQTLSSILQSFGRCEPKHLTMENQNLTFAEYNFFVRHGNIETLRFKNVRIFDENGETVPLEVVMTKLSNVYECCLDNVHCTPQTSTYLLQIPFKNKLKQFKLLKINDKLELYDFFTFLQRNLHRNSSCTFSCCEEASEEFVLEFKRQCSCLLDSHFGAISKSVINVFSAAEYELFVLN